jgi:membrane protein
MVKLSVRSLGRVLAVSFAEFKRNEPLRLAGATAFFTTFALPPILIILVQVIGFLFTVNNLSDRFFGHLSELLGRQSSSQVRSTFLGFTSLADNWFLAIGGFVFLMFVSTTLFKVIKDSINQLWNVKPDSTKPIERQLLTRAVSMIIILLTGILFMAALLAEGLETFLHQHTGELHPHTINFLNTLLNQCISALIVTTWFAILFKVLPDAKASWKVVAVGGLFTGILFTIGKIIIRYMLSFGNLTNVFGASSSVVLLLLFVFYTSFILYYGACFTKVYAAFIKEPIKPAAHSIKYKMVETERE